MTFRYFEDFPPGEAVELGNRVVTEADIIAFAREFDPQLFHMDPAAARQSRFGGLVASGWHSCCIFMRLFVDGLMRESSALAGLGVDEIRWPRPVHPGDRLSARATVIEATPSRSKPDRGFVKHACELSNQHGEAVMTMHALALIARRRAATAPTPLASD
jgi:acyl dehydratase